MTDKAPELFAAFGAADAALEQDLRGYYPMAARVLAKEIRRLKMEKDCRTCRSVVQRNGTGCGSVILCTRGDRYEAMPPLQLWRATW